MTRTFVVHYRYTVTGGTTAFTATTQVDADSRGAAIRSLMQRALCVPSTVDVEILDVSTPFDLPPAAHRGHAVNIAA